MARRWPFWWMGLSHCTSCQLLERSTAEEGPLRTLFLEDSSGVRVSLTFSFWRHYPVSNDRLPFARWRNHLCPQHHGRGGRQVGLFVIRRILVIAAPAVCLLLFAATDLESGLASMRRNDPEKFKNPASDVAAAAWKTDLRSVGFLDPPSKDSTWHPVYSQGPLFFADEHALIAVFTTREEITTLARRDDANRQMPWKVH